MIVEDIYGLFTIRFELWPFHLDLNNDYPLAQIISRMIHVAGVHADSREFGIRDLNKNGYTWVLHRLSVKFDRRIKVGHPIDISTGILNRDGVVTQRIFIITQGGEVIATGMSHWVAIDLKSRRPTPISNVITHDVCIREKPLVDFPIVPRKLIEGDEIFTKAIDHIVRYSDLDLNKHVNTSVWVSVAMNSLDLDRFTNHYVAQADLHFVNEAFWGDTLEIEHHGDGLCDKMRVRGAEGKDCFILSLQWDRK
ncbi:acyl-[acyl-carrier-protein] thioesterase [Porphyromonas sp.]|uniref:acyl-[acyl-carrier-protein] thioesterase n=1 Tax=Porphyromonas sp. TaxID=1924944 RepID=UPI0026DD603B|nr:acyl-ACP thioesterase domain-containing protein [Porphyromonas sp.]MDO4771288.1 thioesterase [Porphyromonas sp.]